MPYRSLFSDHNNTVIEAEVRYAVRHEYALTATDVLARRTRLSFLNAQAALEALPRVVEIMAEELNWSRSRQLAEIKKTTVFLESMGLPEGTQPPKLREPKGLVEKVTDVLPVPTLPLPGLGLSGEKKAERLGRAEDEKERREASSYAYSRTQFEPGEVDELKHAFDGVATKESGQVGKTQLRELVTSGGLKGYEGVRTKDFDYVMEETGFAGRNEIDFEEFVEVRFLYISVLYLLQGQANIPPWVDLCGVKGCSAHPESGEQRPQDDQDEDSRREEWWRCLIYERCSLSMDMLEYLSSLVSNPLTSLHFPLEYCPQPYVLSRRTYYRLWPCCRCDWREVTGYCLALSGVLITQSKLLVNYYTSVV